ncbi:hypothetical protein R5R35_014535 [Gryllus longicercus]|uniref:Uncharacterized protein n=1 Tax=Gryllus longicercus TaxID=2509291 RepID=A0AAN9V816_9ORTH
MDSPVDSYRQNLLRLNDVFELSGLNDGFEIDELSGLRDVFEIDEDELSGLSDVFEITEKELFEVRTKQN